MSGSQQGVNVVCHSRGRSVLTVVYGDEAVARRLVLAGADVHFTDPDEKITQSCTKLSRRGLESL